MANKDDDNWFADFTIGQMTGKGWGFYGEMGNQLYEQQDQNKKRQQEEIERWCQRDNKPKNQIRQKRISHAHKEKPWSSLFAIMGFLAGAGVMYSQPDPSVIASLFVGLIAGYLSGRFYKLIIVSGIIVLIWWMTTQNP